MTRHTCLRPHYFSSHLLSSLLISSTPLSLLSFLVFSCLYMSSLVLFCLVFILLLFFSLLFSSHLISFLHFSPLFSSLLFFSLHSSSLLHHPLESGDGNFHVLLMLRADVPEDVEEAHRLAGDIATAAISMGGTCTGEHGEPCLHIGWSEALHRRTPNISFLYLPLSPNLS